MQGSARFDPSRLYDFVVASNLQWASLTNLSVPILEPIASGLPVRDVQELAENNGARVFGGIIARDHASRSGHKTWAV